MTQSKQNLWVDSLWATRKESISVVIDGEEVTREISVGMSVKSDNRTTSAVLYEKLDQALTKLIEDEKDKWLSEELMRRERDSFKDSVEGMDELMNGKYTIVELEKKAEVPGNGNKATAEPKNNVKFMF